MYNMLDAIKDIIAMESNAGRIYERISSMAEGEMRDNALRLQQEEGNHALQLQALARDVEDMEIPAEVMAAVQGGIQSQVEWINSRASFSNTREFFLQALRWEDESVQLYQDIEQLFTPGSSAGALFAGLAQTEREHMYTILGLLHQTRGTDG